MSDTAQAIADGVWIVRGGPLEMFSAYLIENRSGVIVFDTGIAEMAPAIQEAAAKRGGIERVVLGHAHVDHRGGARLLEADIYCHPAERDDAIGDAGRHYVARAQLGPLMREAAEQLWSHWDAGPVAISGLVGEGDRIADFEVVCLPGHAPGQIALSREHDRLALTSDAFYTLDVETLERVPPRLPHEGLNFDSTMARASLRRLAELEPASAWPGHAAPVTADVGRQLLAAAEGPQ